MGSRVYLDTAPIIYFLEKNPQWYEKIEVFLYKILSLLFLNHSFQFFLNLSFLRNNYYTNLQVEIALQV